MVSLEVAGGAATGDGTARREEAAAEPGAGQSGTGRSGRLRAALARRSVAIALGILTVATGMAYSLWWSPLVQHHTPFSEWITPGDFWATVRAAHFVGWGDFGGIYSATGVVVTFPGLVVLLAPLVMLGSALHLTESYPILLPHPSAWLLYGPVEIALACFSLFGLDALAERLGASRLRRVLVVTVAAVVLWQVPVIWGHPEDAIALGCAAYGLVAVLDERWVPAAWWFGAGIAFQPLVGLIFPVVLAVAGSRRWVPILWRAAIFPALLVAVPLMADWRSASRQLISQPTYPTNPNAHDTPLLALAPRMRSLSPTNHSVPPGQPQYPKHVSPAALKHFPGLPGLKAGVFNHLHAGAKHLPSVVSGGTPRIGAILVALALAWWAARHRHEPALVVWAAAVALASRPVFEAVAFPYYLAPGLALLVIAVAPGRWVPALGACAVALGATTLAYHHLGSWGWWLAVAGVTLALAALAYPYRHETRDRAEGLRAPEPGSAEPLPAPSSPTG